MTTRSHEGLVLRDVKVKRGSKTFTQKRWVKAGADDPIDPKDKKEEIKGEEVKSEESYKIGESINFLGKELKIEKVSESEKTVKLSDGKVYTFRAIRKGEQGISEKFGYHIDQKINFMDREQTITYINDVTNTFELDGKNSYTLKEIKKFSEKPKEEIKIKELKIKEKPKEIKTKKTNTKKLSEQMEKYSVDLKKEVDGEKTLNGILQYTGGDYKLFNEYLRSGKMNIRAYSGKVSLRKPSKAAANEMNEKMNIVSDFLKEAPKMEGTVYRGMVWGSDKKSVKSFNDFMSSVKNNNSIKFPNFSSTSTSEETATDFATSKVGVKSVVIEMKSKSGVYLNGTSAFENEDEVLFDKNSDFKIIKIDQKTEPNKIYLEEI